MPIRRNSYGRVIVLCVAVERRIGIPRNAILCHVIGDVLRIAVVGVQLYGIVDSVVEERICNEAARVNRRSGGVGVQWIASSKGVV